MFFGDGKEDFDYLRVELGAGAAADFFAGVGEWKGFAVRAVADHGVERVGDGENASAQGDLLAFEAAWIAGAIEELLVGEDDFRGIAKKRDANQHVVADFAVLAHDLLFVVGERAGLAENAVGNSHFADVVKESGAGQDGKIGIGNGHGLGDGDAESGHALAVAFGFRVFEVQGAAQGLEGIVVGLLEFGVLRGELGGAFFDELFEVALVGSVFHDQAAVLQSAANAEEELIFLKGLEDVIVSAAANGFESGGNIVDGGDHDHRDFGIVLTKPVQELDAIHLGHDHVAQNEIGCDALDLVLSRTAV